MRRIFEHSKLTLNRSKSAGNVPMTLKKKLTLMTGEEKNIKVLRFLHMCLVKNQRVLGR